MQMKVKKMFGINTSYSFEAPVFSASVPIRNAASDQARVPSFDLNEFLVPNPEKIFLVRVIGDSMIDENIFSADILVVDRDETPENGKVVIASLNGEAAVKTFRMIDDIPYLYSANKNFLPIEIDEYMTFEIQGIVKHVIHDMY
ncbi:MAG: hypothetical protein PF588_00435 [Candidatus Kapabacteria bacterium]|jgi:DNA polymerase V|nr:hypothetical protein [Candidatus Kapabacteria bacterium]